MPFDGTTYEPLLIHDSLVEARSLIERGWCGTGPRSPVGVCMTVALSDAAARKHDYDVYLKAQLALLAAVKDTGFACGGMVEFNDSHTKEEVLAVFDRAISSLDPHETEPQRKVAA